MKTLPGYYDSHIARRLVNSSPPPTEVYSFGLLLVE